MREDSWTNGKYHQGALGPEASEGSAFLVAGTAYAKVLRLERTCSRSLLLALCLPVSLTISYSSCLMEEVQNPLSRCEEGMFSFLLPTFCFITSSLIQDTPLSYSLQSGYPLSWQEALCKPSLSLSAGYASVFQGTQSKRILQREQSHLTMGQLE